MNSKLKPAYIACCLLVLLLLVLLWIYLQEAKSTGSEVLCGQQLELTQFENYTREQEDTLYAYWLNGNLHEHVERIAVSPKLDCAQHKHLTSQGYFLRKAEAQNYLLQAVHAHDDLYTGAIVLQMMQQSDSAKYAALSSSRRRLLDSSVQNTLSNRLALRLTEENEVKAVIQLHGFAQEKRKTRAAQAANIIISSGHTESNFLTNSIYHCLQENFDKVMLFGKNVYELGGTENFLNLALQDAAYSENFVHIELSLQQRKALFDSLELEKFSACLSFGISNAIIN